MAIGVGEPGLVKALGGELRSTEAGVADDCDNRGVGSAPPGGGEGARECDLGGVAAMIGVALTEGTTGALLVCAMGTAAAAGLDGILDTLAASFACLIRTSGCPDDGPDENRFLSVPKKPSLDFLSFSVGAGVDVWAVVAR